MRARAALTRHSPARANSVFLNVRQTSGAVVLASLPTLLSRSGALGTANAEQRRARGLLVRRGLTDPILDEARALLSELTRSLASAPPAPPLRQPALHAFSSWYLDRSETDRATIADAQLRKVLGFA